MLTIAQALVHTIEAHARREHPLEACGLVSGPIGSDHPTTVIPLTNADASPSLFRLDPREQIPVWSRMHRHGEEPIVLYHSHTSTAAFPSPRDLEFALEPQAHYLILSTRDPNTVELRSFRILDATAVEETVRITE
ncbi:M67 family metallopeptidase [Rhodococcus cerastii]|nr:M67 family metallopeptidase [Rhodococcus cerastii]